MESSTRSCHRSPAPETTTSSHAGKRADNAPDSQTPPMNTSSPSMQDVKSKLAELELREKQMRENMASVLSDAAEPSTGDTPVAADGTGESKPSIVGKDLRIDTSGLVGSPCSP